MVFNYLSADVLKGFDTYKYKSIDSSPLSIYVTHPFWNWVVQYFPLWMAPNLITFIGFLLLLLNYILLTYYDPEFYASTDSYSACPPIPIWLWLVCAIGTFVAHTLDGIDGKQARRTKSSTPLGELFDHGLDSWATLFLPVSVYSLFGRGQYGVPPITFYYIVMILMLAFFLSHWEKYITGVMYLPWTYDMSQLCLTLCYVITFFFGHRWVNFTVPFNITFAQIAILYFIISVVTLGIYATAVNIYASYEEKTGKMLSASEAFRPVIPIVLYLTLLSLWLHVSPTDIMHNHSRMVVWLMGTVFSNISCRLIVSQMSDTRCDAFNNLIIPVMVILPLMLLSEEAARLEVKLLWLYTVMATVAHVHYGTNVVRQMADKFNIYVFSLQKREKKGCPPGDGKRN